MSPAHAQYELIAQRDADLLFRASLAPGTYVVGRDRSCDVCIPRENLSRRHARITLRGSEWFIEDLGSRNRTLVNGQEVTALTPFTGSDVIQLGDVEIRLVRRTSPFANTLPPAFLVLQNTRERGVVFQLRGNSVTVGRARGSDIRLDSPSVSREHAVLRGVPEEGCWCLEDAGSANGTSVDGIPTNRAHLRGGERIRFGNVEFLFQNDEAPVARHHKALIVLLLLGLGAAVALLLLSFGLAVDV